MKAKDHERAKVKGLLATMKGHAATERELVRQARDCMKDGYYIGAVEKLMLAQDRAAKRTAIMNTVRALGVW